MHALIIALTPRHISCPVVVSYWDGESFVDQYVTNDYQQAKRDVAATGHPEDYTILPFTGKPRGLCFVTGTAEQNSEVAA